MKKRILVSVLVLIMLVSSSAFAVAEPVTAEGYDSSAHDRFVFEWEDPPANVDEVERAFENAILGIEAESGVRGWEATAKYYSEQDKIMGIGECDAAMVDIDDENAADADVHIAGSTYAGQAYDCRRHKIMGDYCEVDIYRLYYCIVSGHNDTVGTFFESDFRYIH